MKPRVKYNKKFIGRTSQSSIGSREEKFLNEKFSLRSVTVTEICSFACGAYRVWIDDTIEVIKANAISLKLENDRRHKSQKVRDAEADLIVTLRNLCLMKSKEVRGGGFLGNESIFST